MLIFLLACNQPASVPPAGDSDDSGGDGSCAWRVNPLIADVIDLDWTTTADAMSTVEYGLTEAYGETAPAVAGATVHVNLIGLPGDSDVYWHAVSTSSVGTTECTGTAHTESVPGEIPRIDVSIQALPDRSGRYIIGAFFGAAGQSVQLAAYDREGAVVWYYQGDRGQSSLDMHYARSGGGVLFNEFHGSMGGEGGQIRHITMGGDLLETWAAPYAHHMFTELPDGTLTFQRTDIRAYTDPESGESGDWVGDSLAEIPRGGEATTVFSIWDWLTPTWNDRMSAFSIYGGLDWSHGNMIKYDEDKDQYLLSLAHAASILDIHREDMSVLRILGKDGVLAAPPFDYQHDPTWLDDTHLLMFMTDEDGSGAIEYELRDGIPQEVWRQGFETDALALGQATRLPNGDTFVNHGAAARLQQVNAAGELVWEARPSEGNGGGALFAQFMVVDDLYTGAWGG